MTPSSAMDDASEEPIRFRPSKKRKTYRQRTGNNDVDDAQESVDASQKSTLQPSDGMAVMNAHQIDEGLDDDAEPSASAVLRARQRNPRRPHGLTSSGFNSFSSSRPTDDISQVALVPHDGAENKPVIAGISQRFTHQTGILVDINDKHMNEFIESRLSSREKALSSGNPNATNHSTLPASDAASPPLARDKGQANAEGTFARGRILEVDLEHVNKTAIQNPRAAPGAGKQQRLGKDGKPYKRRNRRGSDDIARDKLVEELLHENKLDVYDEPAAPAKQESDEEDADERMAQQFQQQYLNDVAQRRQRRKPQAQPAKGAEEVLRGPKLGGSRNIRSQVRDALLQKQEKGTKK